MIRNRSWYIHLAYLAVGLISVSIGFFVATKYIKKTYSKTYVVAQAEQDSEVPAAEAEAAPAPAEDSNSMTPDAATETAAPLVPSATSADASGAVTSPATEPVPPPPVQGSATDSGVPVPPEGQNAPPSGDSVGSVSSKSLLPESVSLLEPYVFDTREGRRNPFKPPIVNLGMGAQADVSVGPGTPLERYEVDEVKLAAILWDIKNPKAMFIDPTGEVHILTKDDRIGRRRGYIAAIRESEVVVVEITSFSGEQQYSTRILRIDQ